jgi:hypothetical protein
MQQSAPWKVLIQQYLPSLGKNDTVALFVNRLVCRCNCSLRSEQATMNAGSIFLMRMGLGILFAYMVVKIFHIGGGIVTVAGFAVCFVGFAYLLNYLREKRQREERMG